MAKKGLTEITIAAVGLTIASLGAVHAQSPARAFPATEAHELSSQFGIPVVQSRTPLPMAQVDSAQPTARLRDIQQAATSAGMTWEKVYNVSPAGVGEPVTTLADARRMADQSGTVTLSVQDVPAARAIRTVAAADDAKVDLSSALRMGDIDVDLVGASVPDAIATLAARTHTHWAAEYVVGPAANATGSVPLAYAVKPRMTQQQYEETQLFNGPVRIDVAPAPPAPIVVAAKPTTNTPAGTPGTTAAPPAAAPAPYGPYGAPYSPYESYGMYPYGTGFAPPYGYGAPYQVSPGLTLQPGNPWGNQTLVFGAQNPTF